MIFAWLVCLAWLLPADRALPISAHNCYSGASDSRLKEALALGIDNIEIDLGWDEAGKRLIVGHDAVPQPGSTYPTFESYIQPLLDLKARSDGAPHLLTIDWKTSRPEAVAQFKSFLEAHPNLFSTAPKSPVSSLTTRRLTVCFTGSDQAKDLYDALIPQGGTYRGFRDTVHGAGDYRDDPVDYSKERATAYRRFLTFHWGVIEKGGPPRSGTWTPEEAARLAKLVESAHRNGYRIRFYCLNVGGSLLTLPYRFPDANSARIRWRAAAKAGVDWVASDNYAEITDDLRKHADN